jgi:hypothetical protein
MTLTPAPALFSRLVLLDRTAHRELRVQALRDHSPLRQMNAMPCAVAEFGEACKEFPLLFVRASQADATTEGAVQPVCLLGLQAQENLFVAGGDWLASYRPAHLRRHPLALVQAAQPDGRPTRAVAIDEAALVGTPPGTGERLFDESGEPTAHLVAAQQFLHDLDAALSLTQSVCAQLQSLALLKPMRAAGSLRNGQGFEVDGFWVVDEDRLRELPDDAVVALHRNGLMAVIHAHLISLSNINRLVERKERL